VFTSSFVQDVPGNAPVGTYAYTLRIGRFPNVTVDVEMFTVTVTSSARVGEGAGSDVWAVRDVQPWVVSDATAANASALPAEAGLAAYPNPFARQAALVFALPAPERVRLSVYDVLGREVARLVDGEVEAGRHEAVLGGSGLPSGVYLVRLEAGAFVQTRRITRLR
jgi:hypothetical protein